jgi:hypothetical protein
MEIKPIPFTWDHFSAVVELIIEDIQDTEWEPDYIVGIVGAGSIAAVILGEILDKPVYTLKVNLENPEENECNCWMAEDAANGMNILLVDGYNKTGEVFAWVKQDWHSNVMGLVENRWDDIWQKNVGLAAVVNHPDSPVSVNYAGLHSYAQWKFPWIREKTA